MRTSLAARTLRSSHSISTRRPLVGPSLVRALSLSPTLLRSTKIDPSLYVTSKPKILPGVPKPSGKTYSPAIKKMAESIGALVYTQSKTSRAIANTRFILGFCTEAVERNEDFFWDGRSPLFWFGSVAFGSLTVILLVSLKSAACRRPSSRTSRSSASSSCTLLPPFSPFPSSALCYLLPRISFPPEGSTWSDSALSRQTCP